MVTEETEEVVPDPGADLPPLESGQELEAEHTPPIITYDPVPGGEVPHKRVVEVTRIPEPIVIGELVVFPRANGVDYTVDDRVKVQAEKMRNGEMKVKAVAKSGYTFAKGLKQTFNLKS